MIRTATCADAASVCGIYNHYVAASIATFEESPVAIEDMARRIETARSSGTWLVADQDATIVGYASAAPWKLRSAYRYSVESTIYLAPGRTGNGVGTMLYAALIEVLQRRGLHCVIAGIAVPNGPSIALHEKFGFAKVAHFRENGFKFGRWIDVGYWQRVF